MQNSNNSAPKGSSMNASAASRIQSATAKANGGQVSSGSFATRAQSAAASNAGKGGPKGK